MCPLHGPVHDINSCNVMLEQAKSMNLTWSDARGRGAGRVGFQGARKRPAEGEELNYLVDNAVKEILTKKYIKRPSTQVTPAQKTSRSTSTLKHSILRVNEKNPARRGAMTRKFQKVRRRKRNNVR